MMRVFLVAVFLVAIWMMACGPSDATSESDSGASSQQLEESGPALLLDEKSAISILQAYLQDCLFGWDRVYAERMTSQMHRATRAANDREEWDRLYNKTPGPTFTPLPPAPDQLPQSEQQKKSSLIDLASRTIGDIEWSARHHGVAEVPNVYSRTGTAIEAETWVVIGPGLGRAGSQSAAPGRWQVYAGNQRAYYLDAPARLALEEYDSYDSCP